MRASRVAAIVLLALVGCAGKRAGSPPTSAEAAPPPGEAPGAAQIDALAAAEAELAANAAELNALGVKIAWGRDEKKPEEPGRETEPSGEPETPTVEPTEPTKNVKPRPRPERDKGDPSADEPMASSESSCKKICTLASVACDLSKRICQLADDHQGDARYEDACWNAGRQCEDASDACSECTAC